MISPFTQRFPLPELGLAGRRLWLTGGRGFIGSWVVALARRGGATCGLLEGDVTDRRSVAQQLEAFAPDFVIHLAAPVDVRRDPALHPVMQRVIVDGAKAVLDAATCPVLVVGTCEEYGTIAAPFHEDDEPSVPVSPYAAAKLDATALALRRSRDQPVAVARPFLTYGPGQRRRQLVPAAVDAAVEGRRFPMTAGRQTRELNYVGDVAVGLLRAVACEALRGRVVNIGCGEEHRVVDIARLAFEVAAADPDLLQPGALPTRPGEVPHFYADVRRCQELLHHRPAVTLRQGLAWTVEARRAAAGTG